MPSYLITGASRGIGYAFLEHLSSNSSNIVIGLVRNVTATETEVAKLNRKNIHLIQGDLDDYDSLKKAAEATSTITHGKLDVLIANAALVPKDGVWETLSELSTDPVKLEQDMVVQFRTNVVAQAHLINLFMPLILRGDLKQVVAMASGMADTELVAKYGIHESCAYSISKTALNMLIAKFQAEYTKDGVLFLAISPGFVNTGHHDDKPQEDLEKLMAMGEKFKGFAPDFKGPILPDESVRAVLAVMGKANLKDGYGGAFLSHKGDKEWL